MKLWLLLLLLLVTIPTAEAVYIQDPLLTQSSTRTGQITVGTGNYSSIGVSESNTILNDTVYLNASANVTITNVSIAASKTRVNFTGTATTGTLNISAQMRAIGYTYTLLVDNAPYATAVSNAAGWANYTYSGWSSHDFAILQPITLLSPSNGSTTSGNTVTLEWAENPSSASYTYQVSTDQQFINIVSQGLQSSISDGIITASSISLSNSTTYYWRAKNSTGSYTDWFTFTTPAASVVPGWLDVQVRDERNNTVITTFDVQLYNSTSVVTKAAVAGWANFTAAEVASGEYLVRVVPNSSYASRSVLATSPTNVTVYIPSSTYTLDTLAFYLLDYTNDFPYQTSYMVISKNSSTMHSSYFDADAKVSSYLIRGDSYTIAVHNTNNSAMQQWGNYVSTGSGNVEVVLMDLGVNTTKYAPFVYNVTWSSSNITLQWNDAGSVLTSLNYSIYKGSSRTLVHQLITSVTYGRSEYIVTNTSDVYYVYFTATTTQGTKQFSQVIEYRAGSARPDEGRAYNTWSYGTFEVPVWVKSAFALIALMLLAGSFGALHRGEGGIITSIMAVLFWYWDMLDVSTALAGFLGGLLLFAVLYHLESKRRQPYL